MPFDLHYVKEHPYVVGGVAVGALLLVFVLSRQGGGWTASAGGLDPTVAALAGQQAQLTAQSNNLNAQLAATQIQTNAQLQAAQLTAGVQLAGISASQDVTNNQTAAGLDATLAGINGQIQVANDQLTATESQISANLQAVQSNNQTTIDVTSIAADEQKRIAELSAITQQAQISETGQVAVAQTNAAVAIAKSTGGNSKGAVLGGIGGIIGGVAALL